MIDIRKSYLRAPGRWKIVRAILVLLGLVVTSVVTTWVLPQLSRAAIPIFFAWIALVLWADVWMFGPRVRSYLARLAVMWTIMTMLVGVLLLVIL